MRRNILYVGIVLLLSFVSCEVKQSDVVSPDEEVSLEMMFSVPEISISTKGIDDPWDEDLSDWSDWDLFTDGRALYEVTIMLIEEATGNLVGFRDLYADSPYADENNGFLRETSMLEESAALGTSAKATFLYDSPQGGRTIEKLKRGRYQVLAVCNYRQLSDDVYTDGLKGAIGSSLDIDTKFSDLIDNIREEFVSHNGIEEFKNKSLYSDIWTFNIVTDENHLCRRQPQPLTCVSYIELKPGLNKISLNLERTYVRVRVEIENNSGEETLTVNNFDFCDWFTQRAVYLFNDPTDNSRNYEVRSKDSNGNPGLNTHKRSPLLAAEGGANPGNAIVNFSGPVEIPPKESKVIFDGYVFGSKLGATDPTYVQNDSTYQYHLDVEYKGKTYQTPHSLSSQTPISDITGISAGLYLIEMVRHPAFLYVTEVDNLATNSTLDNIISEMSKHTYRYVWELEDRDGGGYYLRNLEEDVYVDYPDDNPLVITLLGKNETNYFQLSNMTDGIQIMGTNSKYFNQHNWTNSYGFPVTNYNANDGGNPCVFYPVKEGEMLDARFDQNVNLELIDPQTSSVYPVQNIKRNDFINILISAAYVPTANQFKIENMVKGWTTKDMEIEFH